VRAYKFVGSGRNLTKLYQRMWLKTGVITGLKILEGVSPTKFGRAKNVQNSARFLITFEFDRVGYRAYMYLRNRSA